MVIVSQVQWQAGGGEAQCSAKHSRAARAGARAGGQASGEVQRAAKAGQAPRTFPPLAGPVQRPLLRAAAARQGLPQPGAARRVRHGVAQRARVVRRPQQQQLPQAAGSAAAEGVPCCRCCQRAWRAARRRRRPRGSRNEVAERLALQEGRPAAVRQARQQRAAGAAAARGAGLPAQRLCCARRLLRQRLAQRGRHC